MAISFIDDLLERLYQFLGRTGWVMIAAGLLLSAIMLGTWFGTGALPHWSALDLGIRAPQTSIDIINRLLAYGWTVRLGIPVALLVMGLSLQLSFGRMARRLAEAEADLYASPTSIDPAPLRPRLALFPTRRRSR